MINFFTKDSQIVAQQILLIRTDRLTEDEVPDLLNLREVVSSVLRDIEREERSTVTDGGSGDD